MNTLDQLKDLIHTTFDIDPATLDATTPMAEYGLDSLSLAELLFVIEDTMNVEFADTPDDVNTLAELAERVDTLRLMKAA